MSADRPNLAAAFKPQETSIKRGTSLQGLLKPRVRSAENSSTSSMGSAIEAEAAALSESKPPAVKSPEVQPRNSSTPASQTVAGAPRNVGVYLPPDVLERVKNAAKTEQITYSDLLVDAFNAVTPDEISRMFRPETESTASVMPRRIRRPRGTAGIQIQLRLDDRQIAWLEDQVTYHRAPSRSALVSAVLQLHTTP